MESPLPLSTPAPLDSPAAPPGGGARLVFGATILASAFLLFWVELLFARLVLPLLGGTPGVWTTCLLFFQVTLLLGYGYAHLSRKLGRRAQVAVHALVLLAPLPFLPLAIPDAWRPPPTAHPLPWVLGLLAVFLLAPFFAVSTTAPLLQRWYSRLGRVDSGDPYFLYAASNAGSLLALVAYPLLIEVTLPLAAQSGLWRYAYGGVVLGTLACGALLARAPRGGSPSTGAVTASIAPAPGGAEALRWLFLSFVPGSLLYGVTTVITTDIAAVPLLWAAPLALYLLSFVLAFSRRAVLPATLLQALVPLLIVGMFASSLLSITRPAWMLLTLHLSGFFGVSWLLHRRLSDLRPAVEHLTGFYLWVALGGLLAGVWNAVCAPLLFPSLLEYPLTLMMAGLLLLTPPAAAAPSPAPPARRSRLLYFALGLLIAVLLAGFQLRGFARNLPAYLLCLPLVFGIGRAFQLGCGRPAVAVVLCVLCGQSGLGPLSGVILSRRNFYGVKRVVDEKLRDEEGQVERHFLAFLHGTTLHGRQDQDPARADAPLTYFHPTGPMGQTFQALAAAGRPARAAVVGLGVGSLAAYAREGQDWTFYEIDPGVEEVARERFSYLARAGERAALRVVLGDARLSLQAEADAAAPRYDVIVMDAFSSDSVPVHLISLEAFDLYLARLGDSGLLAVNVSNHFIDLAPVLGAVCRERGLVGLVQYDLNVPEALRRQGKTASYWAVLGRRREDLLGLDRDPRWRELGPAPGFRAWTDDHASVVPVLRLWE